LPVRPSVRATSWAPLKQTAHTTTTTAIRTSVRAIQRALPDSSRMVASARPGPPSAELPVETPLRLKRAPTWPSAGHRTSCGTTRRTAADLRQFGTQAGRCRAGEAANFRTEPARPWITEAITGARSAIMSGSFSGKPCVADMNDRTSPTGSTPRSSVTKAETAKSASAIKILRLKHNIG
jgi:hypothetical protein